VGLSGIGNKDEKPVEKDGEKESSEESWLKAKESEHAMDVRTFRERFAKLLRDSDIKTLVVLIDDLDRCSPERVIENLEAIKLFLSVPSTAFVIGADPRIVEHAIRQRYAERAASGGSKEDTERLVRDYLEKVVQVPYQLPRLSGSEIETYMVLLFCKLHLKPGEAATCIAKSRSERDANRYGVFGYAKVREALGGGDLKDTLAAALSFCSSAAPLIADGLEGNPRQVKRFLNAFILRKKLAEVARLKDVRDEVLVKLMIPESVLPHYADGDWRTADRSTESSGPSCVIRRMNWQAGSRANRVAAEMPPLPPSHSLLVGDEVQGFPRNPPGSRQAALPPRKQRQRPRPARLRTRQPSLSGPCRPAGQ
jgi:hypothetical protein